MAINDMIKLSSYLLGFFYINVKSLNRKESGTFCYVTDALNNFAGYNEYMYCIGLSVYIVRSFYNAEKVRN